ncbi:type VII secretion protein EccE [Streptomyces sp. NBC_00083]|uniref:type VII secretion protein EccE n=1 Tax=Streptomyces sp. NBC_00083 TaxID=2975647 RepID=UPI00225AC246|nr:type VII secretion protein EccE [Streptomyces sp. NBC_00083]MCX5386038.1 type VII secretion protein EccE [Streptomyces sp. NBC_00083]
MVSPTGTRSRSRERSGAPSGTGPRPAGRSEPSPAVVRQPPPVAAKPAVPRLASRSGRFGSFRLQQLILIESAVALLLAAWVAGPLALVPAGVVAVALVLLAVVRLRGRSLPERLGTAWALRRRRSAGDAPVPPGTLPGLAPAVECDPTLRSYSHGDRDQRPIGMIGDGGFLTVVLQVESDATALRADRGQRPLPLALVRDALDVDDIRLESAQIVLHTQPAPALRLPQQSLAVSNYAPLHARTASPAVRITWIALKLNPELCPEAVAARGGGIGGAQKCAARTALHLASRLTGAGLHTTVLTEEELADAVATSACANPLVTAQAGRAEAPQRRTEESSRSWRCDNRRHTTYWVRRWPRIDAASGTGGLPQLVALLTGVPALATTFSLTIARTSAREATLSGHVRVTGRSEAELAAARQALTRTAREARAGLVPLDNEQLPGMLATLPFGGAR